MLKIAYALCIVALLSGTAWTAASAHSSSAKSQAGIGLVLLAALQR